MENKIEIKDLKLSFGDKQILKGIDLNIPKNSVVALIGPSGCGKSTLLRAINRMHDLNPDAKVTGDILLDGDNIMGSNQDVTAIRRKNGMVLPRPKPFPRANFKSIAYGLKINGLDKKTDVKFSVQEALSVCYVREELKDSLTRSALELSGGQQQRLCI